MFAVTIYVLLSSDMFTFPVYAVFEVLLAGRDLFPVL